MQEGRRNCQPNLGQLSPKEVCESRQIFQSLVDIAPMRPWIQFGFEPTHTFALSFSPHKFQQMISQFLAHIRMPKQPVTHFEWETIEMTKHLQTIEEGPRQHPAENTSVLPGPSPIRLLGQQAHHKRSLEKLDNMGTKAFEQPRRALLMPNQSLRYIGCVALNPIPEGPNMLQRRSNRSEKARHIRDDSYIHSIHWTEPTKAECERQNTGNGRHT